MMKKLCALAAALLAVLAGCGAQDAATPWQAEDISEDFYYVTGDFSQHFLALDADGARYEQALQAVQEYLDGELSHNEAQTSLSQTLDTVQTELDQTEEAVPDDSLTEQLRAVGISPAEYELFINGRVNELQTHQSRLSTLLFYLENAPGDPHAAENLRFFLAADQAELDSLRGYYYYGCYNYWFTDAQAAEHTYLDKTVTEHLTCYYPADAVWYDEKSETEQRAMLCLDGVEAVVDLTTAHVGNQQTELYQLEQNYAALLELVEENRRLEEKLVRLWDISERLEALNAEIVTAKQNGDTERLAALKKELETIAEEYEQLNAADAP